MRLAKYLSVLLLVGTTHAATVFRVDPVPVMTTAGNTPIGGNPALHAVPNASIAIYTDPAATQPATAYTDSTGATACPVNAPVVQAGTSLCSTTTSPQGAFGFWLQLGTYYYKITTQGGNVYGPFPLTVGVPGGNPFAGSVIWQHQSGTDTWIVTKPDGTILPTPNTTTCGLQEAINYAIPYGWALLGYGGWAQTGNPNYTHSLCTFTTTIQIPPVAIGSINIYGVQFQCNVGTGQDCFNFDSSDMLEFDMHHSEVYVAGGSTPSSLFHFQPRTNNGEALVATTATTIRLGEIVPNVGGTGVRFTSAYNPACCANGNGLIVNNRNFDLGNVNGGATCIQVDTPDGRSGTGFFSNGITASCQNQSGSALVIGTTATAPGTGAATGLYLRGNRWDVIIAGGVNTAGTTYSGTSGVGGDYYNLNGATSSGGFTLGTNAYGNEIHTQSLASQLPVTDNSGIAGGNRLYRATVPVRSTISLSTTVGYVPSTLQPCIVTVDGGGGGTISAISVAGDGANYDLTGLTSGSFLIPPGGAIVATFSGTPTTQTKTCY